MLACEISPGFVQPAMESTYLICPILTNVSTWSRSHQIPVPVGLPAPHSVSEGPGCTA